MLLRFWAAAMLFTVQASLADVTEDINNQLAQYQKDMPEDCHIKSPQLKLAYACQPLELAGSNPKLYKSAETAGVNYCFNSLVSVDQAGSRVKITVLKDIGGQLRRFQYSAEEKYLKKNSFGERIVPLEDLSAHCFAYTAEYKQHCSKGFMGFGSTDLPMTIKIKDKGKLGADHAGVIDHDEIKSGRRNGSQLAVSKDFDKTEANNLALAYARGRLVSYAQAELAPNSSLTHRPNTDAAVKTCEAAIAEFQATAQTNIPPLTVEQQKILEKFTSKRLGTAGNRHESRDLPKTGRPKSMKESSGDKPAEGTR